jgi:hypothetical protein
MLRKEGQLFSKYKGNGIRLTTGILPHTVDEIVVGIKGQAGKQKKITTYRDKNGNIIERVFEYPSKTVRSDVYTREYTALDDENIVKSTTIKSYSIPKNISRIWNALSQALGGEVPTKLLNKKTVVTNHVAENVYTGEKVLSQVKQENIHHKNNVLHSFIQYPHLKNGKKTNEPTKSLSFRVNSKTNTIVPDSQIEKGVEMPKEDTFLAYRALDMKDVTEPITKKYIKDRGLQKLHLDINTEYEAQKGEEKLQAFYDDTDGSINFNKNFKMKSKKNLINVASHETEHAWQFFLNDRYTGGSTPRAKEIAQKYGDIKGKKLEKEAKQYSKAIDEYVAFYEDYKTYRSNYIEELARKKGAEEATKYEEQGAKLRSAFPYIPQAVL